ncbi:MAG: hypothetical protein BWZ01_01693 [Deltaproteobacteria bacterium ADurb.BinA179]|nr:hypothetical protein [Deltaproteobacteria bacterium]MDI9541908.1 hypothetical protein [Pseudomonadota bacterium]OPZ27349.1 MAG: hypothetical protein BWZ01_01693 [Deltaproteobacteria bacterium ADurb.BinA179]HNR51565.1 hypothetical protein [Deltaproteobacteria bacterium]HNU74881.1 hypothetical protein [Deltaproteobacteria bacterium]
MADTNSPEYGQQGMRNEKVLERLSTVLLVLATMTSTWSAYQATRWSGVQTVGFSESTIMRAEAARRTNIETQLVSIDVGLFVQYYEAVSKNDKPFADFLFQRFRPELKAATEAWLKSDPMNNPNAPLSPFVMEEYSVEGSNETLALIERAEKTFETARNAKQSMEEYIFLAVLFELVLFFSSTSMKFKTYSLKALMLSLSAAVYAVGLVLLVAVSWQ